MRQLLRQRLTGTTNAGAAVDISAQQIKPGQSARVTHLALANSSGESVKVDFGITSMGNFDRVWAEQTVADSDAVGVLLDLPLLEGDAITARVTGAAKKSTVTFIVGGELRDQTPDLIQILQAAQ